MDSIGLIDAAEWVIKALADDNETTFLKVMYDKGYGTVVKLMDPAMAQAMWDDANVNIQQQRKILRYMKNTFGRRIQIPSTQEFKKVIESEAGGSYKNVDPVCDSIVINASHVSFWHKPLIQALNLSIDSRISMNKQVKSVDIVLGGDHGQRKFRMLVKIILRDEDMKVICSWVIKIGHIDCVKDTYDVLDTTIMRPINAAVSELIGKDMQLMVFDVADDQNRLSACQLQENNGRVPNIRFLNALSNDATHNNYTFNRACPIRVFVTGDLAFYCELVGKVHMSATWCHWCTLFKETWLDVDHVKGRPWTNFELSRVLQQNQGRGRSAQEKKGVVRPRLLMAVEPSNYIVPVLHLEIGLGNSFLNSFFKWVDYRIEMITEEERESKLIYANLLCELDDVLDNLRIWMDNDGVNLNEKKLERVMYVESRNMLNDMNNAFMHNEEERNTLGEFIAVLNNEIQLLTQTKDAFDFDIRVKKMALAKQKKEIVKYQVGRGKKGEIRKKMELKLQEYGIDRPTYHGGDLTGVKVKVLFQNVDVIMAEFKLICDECEEKGATDEEVDEMVGRYSHLGSLLDGVFSFARMPCGTVTLEDERLLERMIKAVMQMWRGLRLSMLGPKIHGLEDHLLDQVKRYKGIGDFAEDFVEQSHQFGVKDELRTRSMSRNRAFMSHVSWEYMSQNSAVLIAKDKMNNTIKKRKRKRRVELDQSKEERDRIRIEKLDAIERGEYELMIDDYAKQTTE